MSWSRRPEPARPEESAEQLVGKVSRILNRSGADYLVIIRDGEESRSRCYGGHLWLLGAARAWCVDQEQGLIRGTEEVY